MEKYTKKLDNHVFNMINSYPKHKSQENRFSEAFIFLLRFYPRLFVHIFFRIFSNNPKLNSIFRATDFSEFEISSQQQVEGDGYVGRPDIVIRLNNKLLIYIENKLDSGIKYRQIDNGNSINQLRLYKKILESKRHYENCCLLFVSKNRHRLSNNLKQDSLFVHVRWDEIYSYILEFFQIIVSDYNENEVEKYFLIHFVKFMEELDLLDESARKMRGEFIEYTMLVRKILSYRKDYLYVQIPHIIVRGTPVEPRLTHNPCFKPDLEDIRFWSGPKAIPVSREIYLKIFEDICLFIFSKQWPAIREQNPLKPLTVSIISETLEIDPSLVSRIVRGKILLTDHGFFELEDLLSPPASEKSSGVSEDKVRKTIRCLIEAETAGAYLSDPQLSCLLEKKGIIIDRQKIGRLRREMGIKSYRERR
ncbi:MAG: PD-(D/E)XK nuclease family protein [bacterium]